MSINKGSIISLWKMLGLAVLIFGLFACDQDTRDAASKTVDDAGEAIEEGYDVAVETAEDAGEAIAEGYDAAIETAGKAGEAIEEQVEELSE